MAPRADALVCSRVAALASLSWFGLLDMAAEETLYDSRGWPGWSAWTWGWMLYRIRALFCAFATFGTA